MRTWFYCYKITNEINDYYYIGKRAYTGVDISEDKYMGSGSLIKRYINKHPDWNWIKNIIGVFDTEKQCYAYEKEMVGEKYRGGLEEDINCLNMYPGGHGFDSQYVRGVLVKNPMRLVKARSPQRRALQSFNTRRAWTDPEKRRRMLVNRRRSIFNPEYKITMINAFNEKEIVDYDQIKDKIKQGYSFIEKLSTGRLRAYSLCNHELKICISAQAKTAKIFLLQDDWFYGERLGYENIGVKEAVAFLSDDIKKLQRSIKLEAAKKGITLIKGEDILVIDDQRDREALISKLKEGYAFKARKVRLTNPETESCSLFNRNTAINILLKYKQVIYGKAVDAPCVSNELFMKGLINE